MSKSIKMVQFLQTLFDHETEAKEAAEIREAVLAARSLRLTGIAVKMRGRPDAACKRIQRFLQGVDPHEVLWRLFREEAPFVLGDVTEVKRPQAQKTEYVGTLKDGKARGFWLLLLATPYRGRAVPCAFLTCSSRTIAARDGSRNLNHFRGIEQVGELLGERPLVLDREFSYLELLQYLIAARVHFIIRSQLGSHPPKFTDANGQEVVQSISRGQNVIYRGLRYKGKVPVNLIGVWKKGRVEPLWVMTDLDPEPALRIYLRRIKIDETFRDFKQLLGPQRQMNKSHEDMEKMVPLLLLVYAVGLFVGEKLRDGKRLSVQHFYPSWGWCRAMSNSCLNLKGGNCA